MTQHSRRQFLTVLGGAALLSASAPVNAATITMDQLLTPARPRTLNRSLKLFAQRTGESFEGVYRVGDMYIGASLKELNRILRDFRTNEMIQMDPALFDIMHHIQEQGYGRGRLAPYEVISAYRSPRTNAMLRRQSRGVAENSYHTKGQAVDFRSPVMSSRRMYRIAKDLKAGGVGYYSRSDFVHIDTGPVRTW